jgi:DNA-binding MarR family transcriptional regulator
MTRGAPRITTFWRGQSGRGWVKILDMGVTHPDSRNAVRLALVPSPPPATPDTPTGVPAGLRLLRSLDRAVLETARDVDLRPMELYALLLLSEVDSEESFTTRTLADQLAASPSQAKQIALRLAARGYVERGGPQGRTRLTAAGRELAGAASAALQGSMVRRISRIERETVARGSAALNALTSF